MTDKVSVAAEIERFLNTIWLPGEVRELRVPKTTQGTISGYYDNSEAFSRDAVNLSGKAPGVYQTINPVKPELLARVSNRLKPFADFATSDRDILSRHFILIDIDPVRPSGISSTDAEQSLALELADRIETYLISHGLPSNSFIKISTGNGTAFWLRINLPNDKENTDLVKHFLESLDFQFSNNAVHVDTSVHNAARIAKIPGTMACKGENTIERPHRISRILKSPEVLVVAPTAALVAIVAILPVKPSILPVNGSRIDVAGWLAKYDIPIRRIKDWNGHRFYEVACQWNPDHNRGEAYVIQFDNGAIDAGCHHNSCQGKTWADLRELKEPGYRGQHNGKHEQVRELSYIITDKNGRQSLDQDQLACDLMAEYYFKTFEDTNQILVYRNGVYQDNGEQFIRAECQRRVGVRSSLSEHRVNEIIGHIRRSTLVKRAEFNKPSETINLQNGLLNVRTRTRSEHTPEFLSTVQLPLVYEPDAQGLGIVRFLSEVLNTSDVPLITEFFGFCLLYEYRIQKAFLLVGEGSNGKSTLLRLLMAFVGEPNCSHVSWQQLELNRFAMADLEGKLVNSFADLPSQGMSMTTAFKMLTGGDSISAERKFMPSFNFVNFAKLIFSTNKPPKVDGEESFAFWRRWVIVEFPNTFTGDADNPNLIDELTTPAELSGLLNLALDGLDRLRAKHAFTYRRSVEETSEYYLRAADPVYAFIQDCCEIGPAYWISKEQCYEAFNANCRAKQVPLLRPNAFARALQNQPSVRISATRPQVGENRVQAWQGIKLVQKNVLEYTMAPADKNSDGKQQTLTEPRLPSGMSGQNDTSIAGAHGNIPLKLQENPDIPDATLKTDSQNPDGNSKNPDGRTTAVLGISINDALSRWRKQGAPIIHLGQCQNCEDLEQLLNQPDIPDYQVQAVKLWLDKNKYLMSI